MTPTLRDLVGRARRLREVAYRSGPEALATAAEDLADDLAALARADTGPGPGPAATWWRAATPTPTPAGDDLTVRRLRALVAHHAGEAERLRRLLASAAPRPRRRHPAHDDRQARLDL